MDDVNPSRAPAPQSVLDRVFGLSTAGTNLRTEFIAGLTTFLTMVYIVFVNPQILGNAGMDKGAVFVATCIAAAASTAGDGALCQLSDRAGARHGAQRVLRLHRRPDDEIHLATGARRRVLLGRDLLRDLDLPDPRIHHQFDPAEFEARDIGRRRLVSRHHRAGGIQDRGGDRRRRWSRSAICAIRWRSCACSASC